MSDQNVRSFSLDSRLAVVHDLPDWLGAVLAKELRQGLRSGVFLWVFRALPVVLALQAIWTLSTTNLASAREFSAGFFWMAVVLPSLVMGPLRATSGIRTERQANAFDLLQLTPLSSTRIVFAKWSSYMVQVLLWIVSLMPFFVMRYFLGGMDIAQEFMALVHFTIIISLATAVSLLVSTLSRLLFWLVLIVFVYGILMSTGSLVVMLLTSSGGRTNLFTITGWSFFVYTLAIAHLCWLFIEWTPSRIAPPAVNYAVRLRLSLMLLPVWPALAFLLGDIEAEWMMAGLVTATVLVWLVTLFDLATEPRLLHSHLRPWRRWGVFGRVGRHFFMPGWVSGALYFVCFNVVAVLLARWFSQEPIDAKSLVIFSGFMFVLLMPRIVACCLPARFSQRPSFHWAAHLGGAVVTITVLSFESTIDEGIYVVSILAPVVIPWLLSFEVAVPLASVGIILGFWWVVGVFILINGSRPHWQRMHELDQADRARCLGVEK